MKQKYLTLFSLYIAQSVPMSFFSTVVPVIMRQEQYSLEAIGLLQLVKLPWIIKFLWAPLVDRHAKGKKQLRRWIILSELFYAFVILSIGFFNLQTDFTLIIALMLLAFIASATQDIATDIFAMRVLTKNEKPFGNGIQSAGSFIGSFLGAGVLLLAYYHFGWQYLLWILAAFVLFAIVPLLVYKPPVDLPESINQKAGLQDIISFFRDKLIRKRVLVLVFYYSGLMGILTMLKPYLVDLGYNIAEIGLMSGIVGTAVAAVCALLAGVFIRKAGRKTSIYIFALINLIAGLYFFILSSQPPSLLALYVGICLLWGAYGCSMVIILTTSMDVVRPHAAGTDFTIQIVISHVSAMLIAVLSGKLGDIAGYRFLFGFEVLLSVLSILILLYVYPIKLKILKK
jgi:MFS family permease